MDVEVANLRDRLSTCLVYPKECELVGKVNGEPGLVAENKSGRHRRYVHVTKTGESDAPDDIVRSYAESLQIQFEEFSGLYLDSRPHRHSSERRQQTKGRTRTQETRLHSLPKIDSPTAVLCRTRLSTPTSEVALKE